MDNVLLLQKLFEFFDTAALVEGSTKHRCRVAVKTVLKCFGPALAAAALDGRKIAEWQLWCKSEGYAGATIRSGFTAVAQIYRWGVRNHLLAVNPFLTAERLRVNKAEVRIFTADEVAALSNAAAALERPDPSAQLRWSALLQVLGESGLRVGEALNLRWEDIDLEEQVLRVRYRPDLWNEYWTWGTKGKTDRRSPMSGDLLACCYRLRELAPWRYPLLKQCTCARLQKEVGSIPEGVRKFPYGNLYREFRQVRTRANVGRGQPIKDGCFHQLRKTAVSTWAARGVPLVDAQYAAGHASLQTTRTYYIAVDAERSIERVRASLAR